MAATLSPLHVALLVSALSAPSLSSTACDVPGVHPDDCHKYKSADKLFYCGGQRERKISLQFVNDDYCDCVGSGDDEPGTAACNHGKFWCANLGYRGRFLYSSLVGDGLCDCCDGSDEAANPRVECENVCAAKARSELTEFVAQRKKYASGMKVKRSLLPVARAKLGEKAQRSKQLEREVKQKRHDLKRGEERKLEAENKEREYKELRQQQRDEEDARLAELRRAECEAQGGAHCDGTDPEEEPEPEPEEEEPEEKEEEERKDETSRERRRRERRERHAERTQRNRDCRDKRRAERAAKRAQEAATADEGQTAEQAQEADVADGPRSRNTSRAWCRGAPRPATLCSR